MDGWGRPKIKSSILLWICLAASSEALTAAKSPQNSIMYLPGQIGLALSMSTSAVLVIMSRAIMPWAMEVYSIIARALRCGIFIESLLVLLLVLLRLSTLRPAFY